MMPTQRGDLNYPAAIRFFQHLGAEFRLWRNRRISEADATRKGQLQTAPDDILFEIFQYLNIRDIQACSCVCQHWHGVIDHNLIFERRCEQALKQTGILEAYSKDNYQNNFKLWLRYFPNISTENLEGRIDHIAFRSLLYRSLSSCFQQCHFFNHSVCFSEQFTARTKSALFSPDARHFALSSANNVTHVWTIFNNEWVKSKTFDSKYGLRCFSFSRDGQYLATGSNNCQFQLCKHINDVWISVNRKVVNPSIRLDSICFSPDSHHTVIRAKDNFILSNIENDSFHKSIVHSCPDISLTQFSPDSQSLFFGDVQGSLFSLKKDKHKNWIPNLQFHLSSSPCKMIFSPDGQYYAVFESSSAFCLIQRADGGCDKTVLAQSVSGNLLDTSFSPDSHHFTLVCDDRSIYTCTKNKSNHQWALNRKITISSIWCLLIAAISLDAQSMGLMTDLSKLRLYRFNSHGDWKMETLFEFSSQISSLAYSPDGRHLAVGDELGRVTILGWYNKKTKWLKKMVLDSHPQGEISRAFFSPNCRFLVSTIETFEADTLRIGEIR